MAYQVLARKYRPQRFADVAGQEHVTVTLMNALRQQRIAHGYIFSGHRGIGKTTIARILAMALNCQLTMGTAERPSPEPCLKCVNCREISSASRGDVSAFEESHSFDVEEIDAATRRGIDDARLITSKISARPTLKSKYKILILDEAHQLTDAAWNSLLKTLEEPPSWAVFMFATTQPEDIPQTVRSRCQHFNFHAVKMVDILHELRGIAAHEGVEADDAALSLLAEAGDGSMRDALSVMDQAIASAPVLTGSEGEAGHAVLSATQIRELMGTVSNAIFERLLEAVDGGRSAEVITLANELMDAGNSPSQLARQCVRYLRNVLMAKVAELTPETAGEDGIATEILQISPDERRRAARTAARFTEEELTRYMQMMLRTFDELGYRQEQRFHFELGLLKLVHLRRLLPMEELLSQLPVTGGPGSSLGSAAAGVSPGLKPGGAGRGGASQAMSQPMRASVAPASAVQRQQATEAVPGKPAFSPFAADSQRKRFEDGASAAKDEVRTGPSPGGLPTSDQAITIPAAIVVPAPKTERRDTPLATAIASEDGSAVVEVENRTADGGRGTILPDLAAVEADWINAAAPDGEAGASSFQHAAIEALLRSSKQSSAGEALEEAEWRLEDGVLRVQTGFSKTMLAMVLNPEADKIARAAIREAGGTALKIEWLPGSAAEKKPGVVKRVARSGSAQSKAEEHPIVKQAQELFHAEIRKVIDLSGK